MKRTKWVGNRVDARAEMVFVLILICVMMLSAASQGGGQVSEPAGREKAVTKTLDVLYGASEERLQDRGGGGVEIDLSGKWRMAGREADSANPFGSGKPRALPAMADWDWHEVSVPGSIRSGLLEAGLIDDPYWSDNAPKSIWTEKKAWWFAKSVVAPKEWAGRKVLLGFDGVDYYSSVWFNGKFIGDHEGMYGGPVFDVTSLVRPGQPNEVVVEIHPGGTDEPGKVFKGYIFMKWHYLTDLSPRGIWRGARLVATGPVRLENPFVRIESANDKEAVLRISADVRNAGGVGKVAINGTISPESFKGPKQSFSVTMELPRGDGVFTHRLRIANPKLWWPVGLGEPNLYRLTLKAGVNAKSSDGISTTFGIRTLVFEPNPGIEPAVNNRFMCRINGKLISMRGAGGFGAHDYLYRLKPDNALGRKPHCLVQLQYQGCQLFSCQLVKSAHTDLLHTDLQNPCINPVNSLESFVTNPQTQKYTEN